MGGLGCSRLAALNVSQVDNGSYGQTRIASAVLGPSYGLMFTDAPNVLAGVMDQNDSNAKERTAARTVAGRIPIAGGIRATRNGLTDMIAGEAKSSKSRRLGDTDIGDSGLGGVSLGDNNL